MTCPQHNHLVEVTFDVGRHGTDARLVKIIDDYLNSSTTKYRTTLAEYMTGKYGIPTTHRYDSTRRCGVVTCTFNTKADAIAFILTIT